MDSSTARCPQCGAAIRPSARFCVTCGIKLPENTPASGAGLAASGWTAREEPTGQDPDPVWAMPAPQSKAPGESETDDAASVTGSAATIQEVDSASSQQPGPGSWLNWPETAAEHHSAAEPLDDPEIQGEIVHLIEELPADAHAATVDEPMTEAVEEIPVDPATRDDDIVEAVAIEDAATAPITAQLNGEARSAPEDEPEPIISGNASPLDEAAYEELNPFDDFASAEWDSPAPPEPTIVPQSIEIDMLDDESANENTGNMLVEETDSDLPLSADGSLDRANALIDELRALLPALVAPAATPEELPEFTAIRDRAVATRGAVSFDRYQALRDVVQDALIRPRDVEVVLRLSRRVEDMDALLTEWDRLQQAFDQLIAELE